jgi:hypothetical protein
MSQENKPLLHVHTTGIRKGRKYRRWEMMKLMGCPNRKQCDAKEIMEGRRTIMKPNEKSMHGANTMNDMSIL